MKEWVYKRRMESLGSDELYIDTGFDKHYKLYESFKNFHISQTLNKYSLTNEKFVKLMAKHTAVKFKFDSLIHFPFVGLVKEDKPNPTFGETAQLEQPEPLPC